MTEYFWSIGYPLAWFCLWWIFIPLSSGYTIIFLIYDYYQIRKRDKLYTAYIIKARFFNGKSYNLSILDDKPQEITDDNGSHNFAKMLEEE